MPQIPKEELRTETLDAEGTSLWTHNAQKTGNRTLLAKYEGNTNNEAFVGRVIIEVTQAMPTVVLKPNQTEITVGQMVEVSLNVSNYWGLTKGVKLALADGTTERTTATLNAFGGAHWPYKAITVGDKNLTAAYGGDWNNTAFKGHVLVAVNKASPSLALKAPLSTLPIGGQVRHGFFHFSLRWSPP